eukprot:359982-Chlamydomonas_euryale.AAC.5
MPCFCLHVVLCCLLPRSLVPALLLPACRPLLPAPSLACAFLAFACMSSFAACRLARLWMPCHSRSW